MMFAKDLDKRKKQATSRDYKKIVKGSLGGMEQFYPLIVVVTTQIYI